MRMAPAPRLHALQMQLVTQCCYPHGPEYMLKLTVCRKVMQQMHWKLCRHAVGGTLINKINACRKMSITP